MTNQQIATAIVKTEKMKAVVKLKGYPNPIEETNLDELGYTTEYFDEIGFDYDLEFVS